MLENKRTCLIVIYSYHHKNTEKIGLKIADRLGAEVKSTEEVSKDMLEAYDVIGFGAGIDSGKHYQELLAFVDRIDTVHEKDAFIFSTSAVQGKDKVDKDHACLRDKLNMKGYRILGEFSCKGFNTNSFLKYFGGMNKGRPNEKDLKDADDFAKILLQRLSVDE